MSIRFLLALSAAALAAFAQQEVVKAVPQTVTSEVRVIHAGAGGDVMFFGAEGAGSSKLIKGAPYSAQTESEHTQTLADGNAISQKQTGAVYRDSEGRTRREQTLGPIGPLPAGTNPIQLIFINDPVAGVSYALDVNKKTAQKVPGLPGLPGIPHAGPVGAFSVSTAQEGVTTRATVQVVNSGTAQPPASESLGTKVIEGVQAEGTRIRMTIPAGQIGNERPIETVMERWYSPQLQATVLSTTDDPRMGKSVYRLTNISLAEPDPSLFSVPPDYTITEGPARQQIIYAPQPAK